LSTEIKNKVYEKLTEPNYYWEIVHRGTQLGWTQIWPQVCGNEEYSGQYRDRPHH